MAVPYSLPWSCWMPWFMSVIFFRRNKNTARLMRLKVTPMTVRGTLYCRSSMRKKSPTKKSRTAVAALPDRTPAIASLKAIREATSAAKRCWKNCMGSLSTCQKKSEESATVSLFCQRVSTNSLRAVMTMSRQTATSIAMTRLNIHSSSCFMESMSSIKILWNTGVANPGKINPRLMRMRKSIADRSARSFFAIALTMLYGLPARRNSLPGLISRAMPV